MVETEGYEFANPGTALLLQDGKIDESLFIGDGLHPNNRGYELIAGEIASSNKSFSKIILHSFTCIAEYFAFTLLQMKGMI